MDLQFRIVFKQGSTNMAADVLSRCHAPNSAWALSFCEPDWLQNVKLGYQEDLEAVKIGIVRDGYLNDNL